MRSLSYEQLYRQVIRKQIYILAGYLEDKSIPTLFKACRLKPISLFLSPNTDLLQRVWIDEFNHSLEIKKKSLALNQQIIEQGSTDIYKHEHPAFLIEQSSKALIGFSETQFFLLLYGSDHYLRAYHYTEKLRPASPLAAGLSFPRALLSFRGTALTEAQISSKAFPDFQWFLTPLPVSHPSIPWEQNQPLRNLI